MKENVKKALRVLGYVAVWLLVAAVIVKCLNVPLVLGGIYAVPILGTALLMFRFFLGVRHILQWLFARTRGAFTWGVEHGKKLFRLCLQLVVMTGLGILYWFFSEWKYVWLALILLLGWNTVSRFVDKL